MKKISENRSFEGWNVWKFVSGRKKLLITLIGLVCVKLTIDPALTGLLAGGAVFEGVWSILEYYFKRLEV